MLAGIFGGNLITILKQEDNRELRPVLTNKQRKRRHAKRNTATFRTFMFGFSIAHFFIFMAGESSVGMEGRPK